MYQYSQGKFSRQAHKGIPEGCYEEEQGLKGFYGPASHLIKPQASTKWTQIEGPLRPHMFDPIKFDSSLGQQRLLYNTHLTLSMKWISPEPRHATRAFRNADGDTIYFCHQGDGEIFSEYGMLSYRGGEYIVVPKCLTHTIFPKTPSAFFMIENLSSHYEEPDRGMVGRHAVYDPATLGKPDLEGQQQRLSELKVRVTEVEIKRLNTITKFEYEDTVYDTIGWKGDLYPYTLHMDNMMPLMSHRAHLPPSAHTTFVAREFVVCTFLPRPLERDKDALKVPFYHQNIDYDEVLFYHAGDFFSRDNLHAGMMSLHPAGFPHGPHPKAVKGVESKTETNEYAVMVDSRWPLQIDEAMSSIEVKEYWKSWRA